MLNQG
ncbi:hypothetical protein F383_11199 [Gossypium arboreum]